MSKRVIVDCDRCDKGTVKHRTGSLWWQVQHLRCAYCKGTGRVYRTEGDLEALVDRLLDEDEAA